MKGLKTTKYDYIDSLRGLAILAVITLHTFYLLPPSNDFLANIAHEGGRGVQLFFIVSALTLFLSIRSKNHKEDYLWQAFYIRRFFRIAPLFFIALIVYVGGIHTQYWAPNGTEWWYILLTLSFMHGWHPETINSIVPGGWTIAVEVTFYLCIPYFFHKLKTIRSTLNLFLMALFFAIISSRVAEYFLLSHYPDSQHYLINFFATSWFFAQLPVFILGILSYQIICKYPEKNRQVGFALLLSSFYLFAAMLELETFANLIPKPIAYGAALSLLVLSLHFHPSRLFVNLGLIWIGRLSFSMYLVHFKVLELLGTKLETFGHGNIGFGSLLLLTLIISLFISYFTYKYIELPGISWGKRCIKRL